MSRIIEDYIMVYFSCTWEIVINYQINTILKKVKIPHIEFKLRHKSVINVINKYMPELNNESIIYIALKIEKILYKLGNYNYILSILIYKYLTGIDEELLEAKFISLYSLHKQKEVKTSIEEINKLKKDFYNKHGNILSKIKAFILIFNNK